MNGSDAGVDHTAASQGKEHAAGRNEISVEAFEERQQGGGEDDVDDPSRPDRLLKCHGRHEFLAGQQSPGSDKGDCRNNAGIEKNADENRHPDGAEEASRSEVRAGFFGGFSDRFEAGHEIRDDLHHQQNRDQRSVRE